MNVIGAAAVPDALHPVRTPRAPYVPASNTTVSPGCAALTALANDCHGADCVPGLPSDPDGDTNFAPAGTPGNPTPGNTEPDDTAAEVVEPGVDAAAEVVDPVLDAAEVDAATVDVDETVAVALGVAGAAVVPAAAVAPDELETVVAPETVELENGDEPEVELEVDAVAEADELEVTGATGRDATGGATTWLGAVLVLGAGRFGAAGFATVCFGPARFALIETSSSGVLTRAATAPRGSSTRRMPCRSALCRRFIARARHLPLIRTRAQLTSLPCSLRRSKATTLPRSIPPTRNRLC